MAKMTKETAKKEMKKLRRDLLGLIMSLQASKTAERKAVIHKEIKALHEEEDKLNGVLSDE